MKDLPKLTRRTLLAIIADNEQRPINFGHHADETDRLEPVKDQWDTPDGPCGRTGGTTEQQEQGQWD